MISREQLQSIEWAIKDEDGGSWCPACASPADIGHKCDCWLARALAAPPAAGAPLDEMRRRWARCAEQSDRYLAQLEAHGIVPDDNCRQTPPKPAAGAPPALVALVATWRKEADRVQHSHGLQQANRLRDCADDLESAIGSPAPAPVVPPALVALEEAVSAVLDHDELHDTLHGTGLAERLRAALGSPAPAPVAPPADQSWADFLMEWVDFNLGKGHTDRAWNEYQEQLKASPAPPAVAGGDAPRKVKRCASESLGRSCLLPLGHSGDHADGVDVWRRQEDQ